MRIDNERFNSLYNNEELSLMEQLDIALDFLDDITGNDKHLNGIVDSFTNMPLQEACELWAGVKDNLEYYKTIEHMGDAVITDVKPQRALWWLQDHRYDLRDLYYFYKGWLANKDEVDNFFSSLDFACVDDIFDLWQTIWSNSVHGWWMPKQWNDPVEGYYDN